MNKNRPLVSVLIGTYNRAKLLPRCLNSILQQTHKNLEIIVVDDHSQDETPVVLKKYQQKYPQKIRYLVNQKNRGISFNSNKAFQLAKGDYLALCGDDDQWFNKHKLNKQLAIFKKNPQIGLVGTWWYEIKNKKIWRHHQPVLPKNLKAKILRGNGLIGGSTALVSRQAWEQVNGFDSQMPKGTDSDLFRRIIFANFQVGIVPEYCVKMYVGGHPRMTSVNSFKSLKKSFSAHLRTIIKFNIWFLRYPQALFRRLIILLGQTYQVLISYGQNPTKARN
ncbi:MAG: glycosyltransferase [Candidatus Pacebacteria bacterium]|nr:glycosyltransferase [Candidatus Paceibacterota bacterium]